MDDTVVKPAPKPKRVRKPKRVVLSPIEIANLALRLAEEENSLNRKMLAVLLKVENNPATIAARLASDVSVLEDIKELVYLSNFENQLDLTFALLGKERKDLNRIYRNLVALEMADGTLPNSLEDAIRKMVDTVFNMGWEAKERLEVLANLNEKM